ncbi:MAG: rhomboid family intramembrane serine protease [Bacteroidota bacterium]|nr:rhomboid family intramembrane serine protease [Bacteroidota bacterium]
MAYREKEYKRRLLTGQDNNALIILIAIHLVVFVIFFFIKTMMNLQHEKEQELTQVFNERILSWAVLPASIHKIGSRPWTILTYMFTHDGFWNLLTNMLWLWGFGRILQDLTGNRKIFPVFLYGALAGAIAFVLTYNLLDSLRDQLPVAFLPGASAGVMAIAIATTAVAPGYRLFPMLNGGIPLWILTAIYVIIDLSAIPGRNPAFYAAHLAGGFTGFLFMYSYRRGHDWGNWINNFFDWVTNLFNPDKPRKGKDIKQELFYRSPGQPYKKTPNVTEQRIDEILDKISQKGFNSLSEEEKDLLKRASQK